MIDITNNTVNILFPYRTKSGVWCFDDADVGLQGEPFVGEINSFLDYFAKGKKKIKLYISTTKIGGENIVIYQLDKLEGKKVIDWYFMEIEGQTGIGWLCPALLKYFKEYPKEIHCKIEI